MGGPDLDSVTRATCPDDSPYKCLPYASCYNSSSYCLPGRVVSCFSKVARENKTELIKFCKQVYNNEVSMPHPSCNLACYHTLNVTEFIPDCMQSSSPFTLDWLHYILMCALLLVSIGLIGALRPRFSQSCSKKPKEYVVTTQDNVNTSWGDAVSIATERRNGPEQPANPQMNSEVRTPLPGDTDITNRVPLLREHVTDFEQEAAESYQRHVPSSTSSGHRDSGSAASGSPSSLDEEQSTMTQDDEVEQPVPTPSTPNDEQAASDRQHQVGLHMSVTSETSETPPTVTSATAYRPPRPSNFE